MSSIQHLACPLGGVAAVQDSCGWSCMTTSSGNCWKHCGRDSKAKLVNAAAWKKNSESNTIKALLHQVRLIIVPSAEPMSPLEHFDGTSSKRKGFASPSCQLESNHHGLPNMGMDRHCEHGIPNHILRKLRPSLWPICLVHGHEMQNWREGGLTEHWRSHLFRKRGLMHLGCVHQ